MKCLLGWKRFYELEPLGSAREDIQFAALRQLLYNINVAQKDRKELKDFLLAFTDEDQAAVQKRREEINWSAMQWAKIEAQAYAEVRAEQEARIRLLEGNQ